MPTAAPRGGDETHFLRLRALGNDRQADDLAAGETDGSYLCASDARVHVGLGASPAITAIVIQWPDGRRDRVQDVSAGRVVTLKRPT